MEQTLTYLLARNFFDNVKDNSHPLPVPKRLNVVTASHLSSWLAEPYKLPTLHLYLS